ncbi:hypothetical protein AJ87_24270 [Rhizobium yanglingense]|nr:hypothetical protein AJ87_24270 [Rhizobium yanglingense]
MSLKKLIDDLQAARGPSRQLDVDIALEMGYKRKEPETIRGPDGSPIKRHLWLVPTGEDVDRVPYYTTSIDYACQLVRQIAPSHVGGCSWEDGAASARIDNDPYCQAATPAIALCIAALRRRLAMAEQPGSQ